MQGLVLVVDLSLGLSHFPVALGQFVEYFDPEVVPEEPGFLAAGALGLELGINEIKCSLESINGFDGTAVLASQPAQEEIVDLKHAVLAAFQRLNLLELMNFDQKPLEDILGVMISICFKFPRGLLLTQQLLAPLPLQFEQAVHQLVHCVYLHDQELLVEYLVVFGVDNAEALGEVGCSLEEVVVAEGSDPGLPHCL